jgi:hypothetical protein
MQQLRDLVDEMSAARLDSRNILEKEEFGRIVGV